MNTNLNIRAGTLRVIVIIGKFLLNNALLLSREEGLPHNANRNIIKGSTLGGKHGCPCFCQALHPGRCKE